MKNSMLYVDFNEMLDYDLVLLSQADVKVDKQGIPVNLYAGLDVTVYMDDVDDEGQPDNLIATGKVELNTSEHFSHVKWCCRIDTHGIRSQSELFGQ